MSLLRAFVHAQCAIPPFPHPPGASLGTTSVETPVLSYSSTPSSHYSLHLYVYLCIYLFMCLPKWAVHSKGSNLFHPVSVMLLGTEVEAGIDLRWARRSLLGWWSCSKSELWGWFYNSINVLKSMNYIFMSGFHINCVPKLSHCLAHSKYSLNNCWRNDFVNI